MHEDSRAEEKILERNWEGITNMFYWIIYYPIYWIIYCKMDKVKKEHCP